MLKDLLEFKIDMSASVSKLSLQLSSSIGVPELESFSSAEHSKSELEEDMSLL